VHKAGLAGWVYRHSRGLEDELVGMDGAKKNAGPSTTPLAIKLQEASLRMTLSLFIDFIQQCPFIDSVHRLYSIALFINSIH
jgi:hypothetical protein